MIHDGENSQKVLVDKLGLTETVYPTRMTKGLADKDNPLDPINNLHSLIRKYMNMHGGFSRKDL